MGFGRVVILLFFFLFFRPKWSSSIRKCAYQVRTQLRQPFQGSKWPFLVIFGPKMVFQSCQGLWNPLKVPLEGQSCWRTAIQVINCLKLEGEGLWVKKNAFQSTLKMPVFDKIQVLTTFQPSRPLFLTKTPPNWPHMSFAFVLGPHGYLLGGPGSKNVRFIAILLNPICQSGP